MVAEWPTSHDLSARLPAEIPGDAFSAGFSVSLRALLREGPRTPRELIQRSAGGSGHRLLVGSAAQVADDLQAWYEAGTADGFTIMPVDTSVDFENFSRLVAPILQERGRFQRDYPDATLGARFFAHAAAEADAHIPAYDETLAASR